MAGKQLQGKKLLVLGASSNETTLVKRAQSLGVYTIVTDYNQDYDISPAKKIADEAWDISWSDIDALEKKCLEAGVDGVTAGYSEFRVENLIKLCRRLNLPCYINEEQLEITRDKIRFKEECRKNGVPVVKEYSCVEEVDAFPVIVKPVDRAGSIGISVAQNMEQLQKAYAYAMDLSVCKRVIIEKYMQARKIDVYYAVEDGKIQLISSCDTIGAKANGLDKVTQSCWLYPMKEQRLYLEQVDPSIRRMIQNMNIQYGCIFFSGFFDENQTFTFFECGFRMEGAHQYNYVQKRGLFHFLDLFIWHALTGHTDAMERGQGVDEAMKCAVINFYAKEGKIREINGVEEIRRMEQCQLALVHGRIGQECRETSAILPKVAVFVLCDSSPQRLTEAAAFVYEKFALIGENGEDLIFDRMDVSQIVNWWDV